MFEVKMCAQKETTEQSSEVMALQNSDRNPNLSSWLYDNL